MKNQKTQQPKVQLHSEALDIGRELGVLYDCVNKTERGAIGGESAIMMQLDRVIDEAVDMKLKMRQQFQF